MFSRSNIRARVMEHVEARIRNGQDEYDAGAEKENDAMLEGIKSLQEVNRRNKSALEEGIISKIIG